MLHMSHVRVLSLILFIALSFSATALTSSSLIANPNFNGDKVVPNSEVATLAIWEIVYDQNGIIISYKIEDCLNQPLLLLKVENTSFASQSVDFSYEIQEFDGSGKISNFRFDQIIDANSNFEGECPLKITPAGQYIVLPTDYLKPVVTVKMN